MTRYKHKTHLYTSLLSHCDTSMQGRCPKLRIKVPKLSLFLAKKMHRNKRHFHIKENANAASDRGSNNMGFSSFIKGKKNNEDNGDNAETERELSRELENNLVCEDDNDELLSIGVVSLSQLIALEDHEGGKTYGKSKIDKKRVRMNHRLMSVLDEKKRRWKNFIIKAKTRKNKFSGADGDGDCDCTVKRYRPTRRKRKVRLWRLLRIPSRMLVIRALKLKMVKSLVTKKKVRKHSEQGKGVDKAEGVFEVELCKRRILMGAKCKPLSSSGVLRYDKDGIHLPDIIP